MRSIREILQIGMGPSSSHTMGPQRAAARFIERHPAAERIRVTLFGSLAATGKGHLTDKAIESALGPRTLTMVWKPEETLPRHPNGMLFEELDASGRAGSSWRVYSVGGGMLAEEGETPAAAGDVYPFSRMSALLEWAAESGEPFWRQVELSEGPTIWPYLEQVWTAMQAAAERGLVAEGVLPGALKLARRARSVVLKARRNREPFQRSGLLAAYALAVAEENAAGHVVVTAPTCGSAGVVPAVIRYVHEALDAPDAEILRALATAALVGNLVRTNASISGAEVGCQGEVGTASAMAAAAAAQMLGGTAPQVEYAAEMGMEHHLGLTCDPVQGLVQIPCIERNAFAATRALDCADYALLTDGVHRVSFDDVTATMKQTGRDLKSAYRETAVGGLAAIRG